jgi:hypothetical protein
MKRIVLGLLLMGGLVACGGSQPQHSQAAAYAVSGHLDLAYGDWTWSRIGEPCYGTGGYSDVASGAQVSVLNASGTILALGKLQDGMGESTGFSPCILNFSVQGLPHSDIYQLRVNQRGGPSYSFADLQRSHWTIAMTLGT